MLNMYVPVPTKWSERMCVTGKEGWIPRKGKGDCLPGKGVRGCVCTGKEGWIPRKGKGVLFTR